MFTGIIEAFGEIAEVKRTAAGVRLRLTTPLASGLRPGDSLAVNGVCLTVVASKDGGAHLEVSPETLRVSAMGSLKRGDVVNLERPLRAGEPIGGHFVLGHVDGTGAVEDIRQDAQFWWVTVRFPSPLAPLIVRKGSIAVDGISLTVAGVDDRRFDIQIVPYTWEHTNLHKIRVNDPVNIECDVLGKYAVRALELARTK